MTEWKRIAVKDESPAGPVHDGYRRLLVTVAGAALVTVGAYLPWLRANPGVEQDGLRLVPSLMTPGLAFVHFVVLFPVGVVLAARLVRGPTRGWALASVVAGLWAVLFSVLLVVVQYTDEGLRFVPEVGWALTVLGGLLLALVGGVTLFEESAAVPRRRI